MAAGGFGSEWMWNLQQQKQPKNSILFICQATGDCQNRCQGVTAAVEAKSESWVAGFQNSSRVWFNPTHSVCSLICALRVRHGAFFYTNKSSPYPRLYIAWSCRAATTVTENSKAFCVPLKLYFTVHLKCLILTSNVWHSTVTDGGVSQSVAKKLLKEYFSHWIMNFILFPHHVIFWILKEKLTEVVKPGPCIL